MAKTITRELACALLPPRPADGHKGTFGKALCVCGCRQYRGAAALSCLGALRAGAGLVTLATEEAVIASVASRILEAVFLPLPNEKALAAAAQKATVCLAGCGMPESGETAALVRRLRGEAAGACVLDAGGLCSLAGDWEALGAHGQALVLTPHIGEMAKLWGRSAAQVAQDAPRYALETAARTGAVTVLKSHRTLVATPDGRLLENTTGNAGLARGGSGDVLAGLLTGLLAQGLCAEDAAVCAVWLHGAAADACAARKSMRGMLPEDLLEDVCGIFLAAEQNSFLK